MRQLDKRLRNILAQITLPDAPRRTLSLGCGDYPESALLHQLYPHWLHIGLDRKSLPLRLTDGIVVQADGLALPFACDFSLILIRHPDVALYSEMWAGIFTSIPHWLATNGVLLITCYTLEEWSFVRRFLTLPALDLDLLSLDPPDLVGRDRYVLGYCNCSSL